MIPKNKINLSLIIFAILAICLIAFVIYPLFLEIEKNSTDLISKRESLISFQKKIEALETFKVLYSKIKPDLEKIDTYFVNPEVPVEFVSFLEKTAQDCQLSIEISSALPLEAEKETWPSLVFQIKSISPFPKLLKFLEKIENSSYLIKVQNLNIKKLTEAEIRKKETEGLSLGYVETILSIKVFTK